MRRIGTVVGSGGALLLGCLLAASARADGGNPPQQKAAAQVLFEQGRASVEKGDFVDACPKFAESERLDPGIGTMLWLADCYETTAHTASAWASFKEAAAAAARRHDGRERVARDRARALEAKLSRLTIAVPRGATGGLQVHRDGTLVGSAEWGVAVPLDPGPHTITASAPGHRPWSLTVQVKLRLDLPTVTVPALPPEVAAGEAHTGSRFGEGTRVDPPALEPGSPDRPRGGQRTIGLAVSAAGIASVLVGTGFALKAKSMYDASNAGGGCLPDNECDPAGSKKRGDATSMALVATATMAAGIAALAGGAILFFTAPRPASPSVAVGPISSGVSMRLTWSW
jgi:serine/threonine-protein kinase